MDNAIIEIPDDRDTWEPPVVHAVKPAEEPPQSPADVFFAQYIVCILLLTVLLILRLYDEGLFDDVTGLFRSRSGAPSEPWAEAAASALRSLWS
ncbi:MAG: hypothetical protein K5695_16045 [Oscillospiraceae bacterium]|nr:hypothetical protein [Oscillospiraceae bacterium]